jgi:hypothetical protein
MKKQDFINKWIGWVSYSDREKLAIEMESDLQEIEKELSQDKWIKIDGITLTNIKRQLINKGCSDALATKLVRITEIQFSNSEIKRLERNENQIERDDNFWK